MKTVVRIGYLFAIIGMAMLIIGGVIYSKKQSFIEDSVIVTGKVVEIERRQSTDSDGFSSYSFYPVCEFVTTSGQKVLFTSATGSNPSGYDVNDEVEIRYLPDNPQKASINNFTNNWLAVTLLGVLGLLFLLVGLSMILVRKRNQQKRKKMMLEGSKISTKFIDVQKNMSLTVNNKHPYQIITHYQKNNELYVFKSENIWYNPASYIDREEIDVWVDPMKMNRYYMDVSFLPEKK